MATTFRQQPPIFNGVRSPMIYTVKDPNVSNVGFQYVLDVYIWAGDSGTIPNNYSYRLKKPPLANDLATFDISKLVESGLDIMLEPYNVLDVTTAGNSVLNVACRAGWTDSEGGEDLGNVTSDVVFASNGYYEYTEGLNYNIAKDSLSDKEKFIIREDGNEIASTFYDTSLNVTLIVYRSKSATYILDLSNYYSQIGTLNNDEKILYFPIGINSLTEYNNNVGPFGDLTDLLIEGLESITFRSSFGDVTYPVEILCEPKYQPITVYFVNRYGSWEFLNFMKRKDFKTTRNGNEYTTRAFRYESEQLTYGIDRGQVKRYNVDGQEFITMSTGFVDQKTGDAVQQMLMSENIVAWESTNNPNPTPLHIENQEVNYGLGVNDKLINYTITFKVAATLINTM